MDPRAQYYYDREKNKEREELLHTVVELYLRLEEQENYRISNTEAMKAMHLQHVKLQESHEALGAENIALKEALKAIAEKERLRVKEIYGRGTERLSDLLDDVTVEEVNDETQCESGDLAEEAAKGKKKKSRIKISYGARSKKKAAQKVDLERLPQRSCFELNVKELNHTYGEGNWRIVCWKEKKTIEHPPVTDYCLTTYTPVLSVGLEHEMVAFPKKSLLPGSFVSPSFLAYVEYERLFLSLPFYRLSESFRHFGLNISRQTLDGWFLRFAETHFSLVFDKLQEELMHIPYHQCDETFCRVNRDGRRAGSYSYMWVHRSSELYPDHQIILFCFESTRGADHLRKFYEDFRGVITCDAYCAYRVLESEKAEVVRICGCLMHLRRRFANSLALIDKTGLSDEAIDALPETQALKRIGQIYAEDEQLKSLEPPERKRLRKEKVKPLVDEFYTYIEGLPEDPGRSNRLKDAIGYAKSQKEYLCRFLDDGQVPIDDGATERAIRTFAISKKNSMFCGSPRGAEATAIMYSILETAKANNCNVYLYLRYLLEEITRHLEDTTMSFLDAMLPWAEEYRAYEAQCLERSMDSWLVGTHGKKPELPKTPKKGKRSKLKDEPAA